jgi:NAD(P)-dependent dehydrogenase (short-subunit alcohol dehydrogenase family)
MSGPLAGKTAVITGSGRNGGLGEAIALRLAEDGANIVLSDIGASRDAATPDSMIGLSAEMEEIAAAIRAKGVEVSAKACDVRRRDEVQALADHAVATHGSLDIWVNNAGIGYIVKPLLDVSEDEWRAVIDVNLSGAFYGVQAAAQRMVAQGRGGRIVNVASQARAGRPGPFRRDGTGRSWDHREQRLPQSRDDGSWCLAERILRREAGQDDRAVHGRHGRPHSDGPSGPARRHGQCRGVPVPGRRRLHHRRIDERVRWRRAALMR